MRDESLNEWLPCFKCLCLCACVCVSLYVRVRVGFFSHCSLTVRCYHCCSCCLLPLLRLNRASFIKLINYLELKTWNAISFFFRRTLIQISMENFLNDRLIEISTSQKVKLLKQKFTPRIWTSVDADEVEVDEQQQQQQKTKHTSSSI